MADLAKELDRLEQAMNEVAGGRRVPYLGPGVSALSGGAAPTSPQALSARIEAEVRVPRRASGKLWEAAQYVESRKFRATLDHIVRKAFDTPSERPNPVHDWLARVAPPLVVDSWYDDYLLQAFGDRDWGLALGVSRNGTWVEIFYRAYDKTGAEIEAADPAWKTLIYKPHGLAKEGYGYLMSDSDYVEVLTEIDIQTPIPDEVQTRRTGRPFLFLGCRFDDQMLRIFARQIAKRSGAGHIALIEGPLTRMEQKFAQELGITVLDLPVTAVVDQLSVPEG